MPSLDATAPIGAAPKTVEKAVDEDLRPPQFTTAQVERGRKAYMANCSDCHGDQLNNGEFGGAPLKGNYFDEHWGPTTVDALYSFTQSAMPPNRPGALTDKTYTDITTFLLSQNGYAASGSEMPPDMDAMATMTLER
ncbi:c-type cytochrome [Paracoccus suum]|nr:cytochrome c [Paracoccus suum]